MHGMRYKAAVVTTVKDHHNLAVNMADAGIANGALCYQVTEVDEKVDPMKHLHMLMKASHSMLAYRGRDPRALNATIFQASHVVQLLV